MKIAICEDEIFWRIQLENMIRRWAEEKRVVLDLRSFPDSESFWFAWLEEKDWDALFLDIEMGQENGMQLAERIRREDEETAIIFTTGYTEYMPKGYDVGAMQYLIKPVEESRLTACLDRIGKRQQEQEKKLCFVTADQVRISLAPSRIWYVEAEGHHCILYTKEQSYELKMSMTEALKALQGEKEFVKCHRSYLVNLRHVRQVRREEIMMDDGSRIPVSRSAYMEVGGAFMRFYADSKNTGANEE